MKIISRLCWPCIIIGIISFAYGTAALAQSGISTSPDYAIWFSVFAGLLASLVGAFAKTQDTRIKENREDIDKLRKEFSDHKLAIVREHHNKTDIRELLSSTTTLFIEKLADNRSNTRAAHRRLDKINAPPAFID